MKNNKKINISLVSKKELIFDTLYTIIILFIMVIIILNPKKYTNGTIEGVKLFFYSVFPGLFTFLLLTKLLTEFQVVEKTFSKFDNISYKIFGTPGISLYVFFMSIVSGYPIGSKLICDYYNKKYINENEAKRMSIFCTTSGPIFVIGAVGTIMFNNYFYGVIIYLSHIISSILLGLLSNILNKKNTNKHTIIINQYKLVKNNNLITFCINETINSLFIVCSYIIIFYIIGEIFDTIKIFYLLNKMLIPLSKIIKFDEKYINGIIYGLLEVTRGIKTISIYGTTTSIIVSTGLLSFSGLSIIFQSLYFLKQAKIKTHTFVFYKCMHSILSMLICYFAIKIFI